MYCNYIRHALYRAADAISPFVNAECRRWIGFNTEIRWVQSIWVGLDLKKVRNPCPILCYQIARRCHRLFAVILAESELLTIAQEVAIVGNGGLGEVRNLGLLSKMYRPSI